MGVFGGSDAKRTFGGGASIFGSEGSDDVQVDLNLTPLMDVMSNILFFLMASFGAAVISFVAVSVPVQSDSPGAAPKSDSVMVNLRVMPDEYRISVSNEAVEQARLDAHRKVLPKVNGKYDDAKLGDLLYRIKVDFPASDTLMIVPSETTVYEEIIRIMDAAREHTADGKKIRVLPKVVVADLVKAESAE